MGPRSGYIGRPAAQTRTSGRAASAAMVRAPRVSSRDTNVMGKMVDRTAVRHAQSMATGATSDPAHTNSARKMTHQLPQPYRWCASSMFRTVLCHAAPALIALCIGALSIMIVDRSLPFTQTWGKIVPPIVMAGQEVTFHFELYRHTSYGGTVQRWIVDSKGVIFTLKDTGTVNDIAPLDQAKEIIKSFPVPCGIGTGPAMYHSNAQVYTWWNLVQRFFWPVEAHVNYPFTVKPGFYDNACAHINEQAGPTGPTGPAGPAGPAGPQGKSG